MEAHVLEKWWKSNSSRDSRFFFCSNSNNTNMNLPILPKGNCFIHSICFWLLNKNVKLRFIFRISNGILVPSCHCVYENEFKIFYRRRPRKNGSMANFLGRPQILSISKLQYLENEKSKKSE